MNNLIYNKYIINKDYKSLKHSELSNTIMSEQTVFDVLEADHIARTDIENATLYNLDDICNENCDLLINKVYTGPEVQFYNKGSNHKIYSSSYVIKSFYNKYPYFLGVDLSNLYIAGGAISQFVKHKFNSLDIDVFVYGLTNIEANKKVVKFINDIELNISTKYQLITTKIYGPDTDLIAHIINKTHAVYLPTLTHFILSRTSNISEDEWNLFISTHCMYFSRSSVINTNSVKYILDPYHKQCVITDYSVTVEFECTPMQSRSILPDNTDIKIQIISRLYKTKQEILYGFDLGSCAVGFDGQLVEFSIAGKFAQEYNLNILDTTRFSLNHGSRLKKYFDRGYGVIFPLCKPLCDSRVNHDVYIRFYNMTFKYNYNKYRYPFESRDQRFNVDMYTNNSNSDYGVDAILNGSIIESRENIYLKNTIFKLTNGYKGYYIYDTLKSVMQFYTILTRLPTIKLDEIKKFYEFMHIKVWKNGCLDMKIITSYIPEFNFPEFCGIVKSKSGSPGQYIREAAIKQYENVRKRVEVLGIDENPGLYIGIKWTTSDVMSQKSLLTGSFHPVYMDNAKFYTAKYYLSR